MTPEQYGLACSWLWQNGVWFGAGIGASLGFFVGVLIARVWK